MQDEMTPGGDLPPEPDANAPDPSRALPVPRNPALPDRDEAGERRPELRQIGRLLEQAAGLALDVLDVAGDMIAERLGLRRRDSERQTDVH